MRGADGSADVLKTYAAWARERAANEARALDLLEDVPAAPAPRVVSRGERVDEADAVPAPYLLMTRLPGLRWADRRSTLTAYTVRLGAPGRRGAAAATARSRAEGSARCFLRG